MLFAKKITRDTESVFALEEKKKKRKEKEEKGGTSFSSLVREFFQAQMPNVVQHKKNRGANQPMEED